MWLSPFSQNRTTELNCFYLIGLNHLSLILAFAGLSNIHGLKIVSDVKSPIVFLGLKNSTGSLKSDSQLLEHIAEQVIQLFSDFFRSYFLAVNVSYWLHILMEQFVCTGILGLWLIFVKLQLEEMSFGDARVGL